MPRKRHVQEDHAMRTVTDVMGEQRPSGQSGQRPATGAGTGRAGDPVLAEAVLHRALPSEPVVGTIAATTPCLRGKSASFVRHIEIDVSGTPLAGRFRAGQSFGIVPPGEDAHGRAHRVRLYSVACPSWGEDGDGQVVSTIAARLIDERRPPRGRDDAKAGGLHLGVCSNYMCDRRVGEEVLLTGPSGKSLLLPADPARHDYVFVATGTGIAPFRGMIMELLEHPEGPCPSQIRLIVGTAYTTDLVFDAAFRAYAKRHGNFRYLTAISREPSDGVDRGRYVDEVMEEQMAGDLGVLLAGRRTLIYICGVAGMQIGMYRLLARHGLAEAYLRIRDEGLVGLAPDAWPAERMRRGVRPSKRCLIEVY